MPEGSFTREYEGRVTNSSDGDYVRTLVRGKHEVFVDEPADLEVGAGNDDYLSSVDYMALSLATCQVSVLSQALERARIETFDIECNYVIDKAGTGDVGEDMPSHTATRVQHVDIELNLEVPEEFEQRAQRCLDTYDIGCIVGQSFKAGVDYTPHTSLDVTDE